MVDRHEDWDPPSSWTAEQEWMPRPIGKRPLLSNNFLMHLWNHPHNTRSFRARQYCRGKLDALHCTAVERVKKPLRAAWPWKWRSSALPTAHDRLSRAGPNENEEHDVEMNEIIRSCGRTADRPCAIAGSSPLKVGTQLVATAEDWPYGWGIYLEEGFAVPTSIRSMTLFLMLCLLIGVLVYCISSVAKYGIDVFSVWEATIALCALLAMFLLRISDVN